jgi:hypothetical protein
MSAERQNDMDTGISIPPEVRSKRRYALILWPSQLKEANEIRTIAVSIKVSIPGPAFRYTKVTG